MADLQLNRVRKVYGSFTAVNGIDLTFEHGKLTALLGPSGCGKTTLLRMIAGLETPTDGHILLGSDDLTCIPTEKRNFGMVFQSLALFPHMSVAENVAYSLKIAGRSRSDCESRAEELLRLVQLEELGRRRIGELSGGQRQRVAIARALAQEPKVFLLDEPMSALDAQLRGDMQMELRRLQQRLGITTIVVTHDQKEAMTIADRVVVMSRGNAEQVGDPHDIYHRPANGFVASFIGNANLLPGAMRGAQVHVGGDCFDIPKAMRDPGCDDVLLFIRPEAIRLCHEAPASNGLGAEVNFVRDLGPTIEIHLTTDHGDITAEMAGTANVGMKIGDRLFLEFPCESLRVLPQTPEVRVP